MGNHAAQYSVNVMRNCLLFLALISVATACASGGGIFQAPRPSGTIEARFVGSNTVLTSGPSNPLIVHNGFAIELREENYSSQFTAAIASYSAPTIMSCYTVAIDGAGKIATFTPRAAPPIAAPTASPAPPSPCSPPSSDVESVLFQDQQGHSLTHYFQNQ